MSHWCDWFSIAYLSYFACTMPVLCLLCLYYACTMPTMLVLCLYYASTMPIMPVLCLYYAYYACTILVLCPLCLYYACTMPTMSTMSVLCLLCLFITTLLLGTLGRQRRDVPRSMVNKMELYKSKFVYNHQDRICLAAYQAKKNKLTVIMLSSSHFEGVVSTDEARKPGMILEYNKQKRGVDMFDENMEEFSCRRKTVRWPLLFCYNLLDTATNNGYILLKKSGTYTCSKKVFLKNLTFDLAKPAVDTRLKLARQKESVKTAAIQMGFSLTSVLAPQNPNTGASGSNQKT